MSQLILAICAVVILSLLILTQGKKDAAIIDQMKTVKYQQEAMEIASGYMKMIAREDRPFDKETKDKEVTSASSLSDIGNLDRSEESALSSTDSVYYTRFDDLDDFHNLKLYVKIDTLRGGGTENKPLVYCIKPDLTIFNNSNDIKHNYFYLLLKISYLDNNYAETSSKTFLKKVTIEVTPPESVDLDEANKGKVVLESVVGYSNLMDSR